MEKQVEIKKRSNLKAKQTILAFSSLILLIIIFSIASPNFLTGNNVITILLMTAVNGILATGITFVIVTGGIDLSIGTVMTFCSVVTGIFITNLGFPIPVGIILGILAGVFCGFINGLTIAKLGLPPFIATLGMMNIAKGFNLVISGTAPIYFIDKPIFGTIATRPVFGIPLGVIIFFASALIASFILVKTVIGRYAFAIGSNEEAARLSGINVKKVRMISYVICGVLAAVSGIVMMSRINSGQPLSGNGMEMDALIACVVGGISVMGGEGRATGMIGGMLVMGVLANGLAVAGTNEYLQQVVKGAVLVIVVAVDSLSRLKKN
jgi:ribose transport system permease protein